MTVDLRTQQQLARWYSLKDIDVQLDLVKDPSRFIVVPAGRRSGKTERAKRRVIKECFKNDGGLYFIAAPTYQQVKKIFWEDVKKMSLSTMHERKPSESNLIIYFNNGTELHLIGLDKPSRIEGIPWDGGIIDEAAYIKEEAWVTSIAPALDTQDPSRPDKPKAWCWIIGKPDGLNWYYRLYQYAITSGDPEWAGYTWPSSVVLDSGTIDAARRRMSPKQFRQEYEASFETVSGRIYDDYSPDNYTDETIKDHEIICYYCDFNFTPMSHGIGVIRDDNIYMLDEIILTSAVAQDNALEFVEKYKNHKNKRIRLYGDSNGKNGEKHGIESEYINMERVFRQYGWTVDRRVKSKNPAIKDRQNAVRAKVKNADGGVSLFVNPKTAPWTHEGMATVQVKEGSTFLEDDKNDYQHITTALGYFIDYEYPIDDIVPDFNLTFWAEEPAKQIKGDDDGWQE